MARIKRCIRCGISERETPLTAFWHSTGTRYTCDRCAPLIACGGYGRENHETRGNETKSGFTLSKEFELPNAARNVVGRDGMAYMVSQGFDPTSDGSVWIEMKTPIYKNLNAWTRVSKQLEVRFCAVDASWTADASYGTHTNVGHPDLDMTIVRLWYKSLFGRMFETLRAADAERVRALFGRTPTYYAHIPSSWDMDNNASVHEIIWNTQHETHLECRLVKWTGAAQDGRATKYAIETVAAVVDFCREVNANRESLSGEALRQANRKAATKAGRKVDNILRKHLGIARANSTRGYESRR